MAQPKEEQAVTIKPANKEKQILRQQQVNKLQQDNINNLKEDELPTALPIDDKYIFGLAKHPNSNNNDNDINNDDEEDQEEEDETDNYASRYLPHDWSEVWDKQEFIKTKSGGNFCCYSAGINNDNLIFVCLHGCGHAALSYSMIAKLVKDKYQIFSFDYRGHGLTTFDDKNKKNNDDQKEDNTDTKTNENDNNNNNDLPTSMNDYFNKHFNKSGLNTFGGPGSLRKSQQKKKDDGGEEYKMSKDNLVSDIIEIVNSKYGTDDPPPIVLVGHSLGGALAVHTAQIKGMDGIPSLVGIVVIDLVEGTALNSLIHMRSIINRRPKSFVTMEQAIKYCATSGMIRNYKSAQLSVPPMFIEDDNGKFIWRTKVLLSEPYWREWFLGLSELFLKSPVSKMLMLADTDRLDKPLTIGQMQGKYELCIVGCGVGHTLHEDAPKKVADKLLHFVERNQFIKLWQINKKFKLKKK